MDTYQQFIHQSRYSRWLDEFGRRETLSETIYRYLSFMEKHIKDNYNVDISGYRHRLYKSISNLDVMPSMRALMTAGPALSKENIAGYNCSFLPVDHPRAFDEALYILMNGTGVGFSVERNYVDKLPTVPNNLNKSPETFLVPDSKRGWAEALRLLIASLYKGDIIEFDTQHIRGAGERLKTFGGRASGPIPLLNLRSFVINTFMNARGRKLTDLECHDIMCKIGEIVVVGGVRRSAMISLSNMSSNRMRDCKAGEWWNNAPHRALANNSWVAHGGRVDAQTFLEEWTSLVKSGSGERGIFNRDASKAQAKKFNRDTNWEFGTNPCSEIILRPYQFCNLSEVVARSDDTLDTLKEKVEMATILGTIQSTLTEFRHLRKIWQQNTEDERLLGVSITGIYDCPLLTKQNSNLEKTLEHLRDHAISINKSLSKSLGIKPSVAITCVKPSGTVSQLVDSASGIHPRHSCFYIRTVRGDNKDPLTQFLKDKGVPNEPEFNQPDSMTVFSFPIKAPNGITREDIDPIQHLELWSIYQEHWCMHKPSITVSVPDKDWVRVGAWVYENFEKISGISFLPFSEHTYAQAPYQECTEEEYNTLLSKIPEINWEDLAEYEGGIDSTKSSQTMACSADGGGCEIVDI